MSGLDFSGKQQLYSQLYDILFQDIVNSVYAVGDLIPSESDLMRTYGVSRATARKAMEMLSNNGLIQKRRGHGSEVVSNTPTTSPQHVTSYIRKAVADRVAPVKRTIDCGVVGASKEVSRLLDVPVGIEMYYLRRVRCSGNIPFYLETIFAELSYVPAALGRDFSKESWRGFLNNDCNIHWSRAMQSIFAISADKEKSGYLDVLQGSPVIYIERISYDGDNRPRELVQSHYRADLYHLEIELDS